MEAYAAGLEKVRLEKEAAAKAEKIRREEEANAAAEAENI